MYRLNVPTTSSNESFDAAVATIRSEIEKAPYNRAAATVQARCEIFDQLASGHRFNDAQSSDFDVSELTNQDAMVDLYDKQFSKGLGTKTIRNSIRNAAPNDLCPYCGEGVVAELDHYLPKSAFAGITVHPANLVPACRDCNYAKRAYKPGPNKPAVLHPYFDPAFNVRWLRASMVRSETGSPVINFFIGLDQNDPDLEARLVAHMQVFKLSDRFSVKAAQSLDNFQATLNSDIGLGMTLEKAQQHLSFTIVQQSGGRLNSWEAAAHEAMLVSDWYLTQHLGLV